jgi:hypothetical protein
VDNIKVDLSEIVWKGAEFINLLQNGNERRTFMNMVMNIRIS